MYFPVNLKLLNFALILSAMCWILQPIATAQAAALPDSAFIQGFVAHAQYYSLSCESRSAADWANFWGVSVTESGFLKKLPRSDNPDEGFVGDPNDLWGFTPPASYGVHAAPVAALLRAYGLQAEARQGLRWKDVRAEVAAGRPVIVWVIGQMWNGTSYRYQGSSGKVARVAPYEHTMVVTGYTPKLVQVEDAYSGRTLTFPVKTFLASWSVLGNMAVTGAGLAGKDTTVHSGDSAEAIASAPASVPAQATATVPSTYTVRRGEYLIGIAERFGVDWTTLVALNNIPSPFTIFTGQVLQLPQAAVAQPAAAAPEQPAAGKPSVPDTYVVQRGDYLKRIAQQYDLDWRILASLNGIEYPYVIYAGQVLKLK